MSNLSLNNDQLEDPAGADHNNIPTRGQDARTLQDVHLAAATVELAVQEAKERVLILQRAMDAEKRVKVKSKKVIAFDGKKLLEPFLLEFRGEADIQGLTGDDRAMGQLLIASLTGEALNWAASFKDKLPKGYEALLKLLQETYKRSGACGEAQNKLKVLRQITEGAQFNARFNTLVQQAEYDLHSRQTKELYLEALSLQVRAARVGKEDADETLPQIQQWAESTINALIRINDAKGLRPIHWEHPRQSNQGSRYGGVERAEVNMIGEDKSCFKCGKKGHLARDCRGEGKNEAGKEGPGKCWACGEAGHQQRHCPRFMEWKKRVREDRGDEGSDPSKKKDF